MKRGRKPIANKEKYFCLICGSNNRKFFSFKHQLCNACKCRRMRKLTNYDSKKSEYKRRFGGLRDIILLRDDYSCQICGMTNDEHKKLFGRSITLDHIDGAGRYSRFPRNETSNLQVLCLRCHGRKDSLRYWLRRSV